MSEFPADPQLSKMLIAASSSKLRCVTEAVIVAAMLDGGGLASVFYRPKDRGAMADAARRSFSSPPTGSLGDHLALFEVYRRWKEEANYSRAYCREHFIQEKYMSRARDVFDQLTEVCARAELGGGASGSSSSALPPDAPPLHVRLRKAIASGYFFNACRRARSGNYLTGESSVPPPSLLMRVFPFSFD